MKGTEAVDISVGEEVGEPLSFFWQEAGVVGVSDGVVNIDGFVADVVIAGEYQLRA